MALWGTTLSVSPWKQRTFILELTDIQTVKTNATEIELQLQARKKHEKTAGRDSCHPSKIWFRQGSTSKQSEMENHFQQIAPVLENQRCVRNTFDGICLLPPSKAWHFIHTKVRFADKQRECVFNDRGVIHILQN